MGASAGCGGARTRKELRAVLDWAVHVLRIGFGA